MVVCKYSICNPGVGYINLWSNWRFPIAGSQQTPKLARPRLVFVKMYQHHAKPIFIFHFINNCLKSISFIWSRQNSDVRLGDVLGDGPEIVGQGRWGSSHTSKEPIDICVLESPSLVVSSLFCSSFTQTGLKHTSPTKKNFMHEQAFAGRDSWLMKAC